MRYWKPVEEINSATPVPIGIKQKVGVEFTWNQKLDMPQNFGKILKKSLDKSIKAWYNKYIN